MLILEAVIFARATEQPLAPDQQFAVDFGKLVHNQIADRSGHVLPSNLTSGAYRILDLNENPTGSLYEGKVITDTTFGNVTYGCMICCGPDSPFMIYDPIGVPVDGFGDQGVQAINSCSNRLVTITGDFPTWWTDNTSIATANGYQINGVAVGSTNNNALSINMYWGPKEDSGGGACPTSQEQPVGPVNVAPVITSIGPSYLNAGDQKKSLTINGAGFGFSPITTLPSGVTLDSTNQTTTSNTQIQFSAVNVAANAYIGANSITVTANGLESNAAGFTIDGPDHMVVVSDTLGKCSGCAAAVRRLVIFQVTKFSLSPVFVIPIGEAPTVSGWNCSQPNPGFIYTHCSEGVDTDTNGMFSDQWSIASDAYTPVGCGFNLTTRWQWCAAPKTFGTLTGYTHADAINMNGVVNPPNQFVAGTVIYP